RDSQQTAGVGRNIPDSYSGHRTSVARTGVWAAVFAVLVAADAVAEYLLLAGPRLAERPRRRAEALEHLRRVLQRPDEPLLQRGDQDAVGDPLRSGGWLIARRRPCRSRSATARHRRSRCP